MPADIVFDTKVTENMQVHHAASHKWYYLEDQDPSELLVFRQAESHPVDGRVGMFVLNRSQCFWAPRRSFIHLVFRCTSYIVPESDGESG